jgi:chromosome segregation ATPase
MWKDLLETETTRREQADEENSALREELWRRKADTASGISFNHSSVGQNARSHRGPSQVNGLNPYTDSNGVVSAASSTAIERLEHENAGLKRSVDAQMSMLTSRNRERDRLYQAIEDLKIGQRLGGSSRSVNGDSVLDRSASRAHNRSTSRASDATRVTHLSEAEREAYETKNDELRDENSKLKLEQQGLVTEIDKLLKEIDQGYQTKAESETLRLQLEDTTEQARQDILLMQRERDEALELHEDAENNFESLKDEAQQRIYTLEEEVEQKTDFIEKLETELANDDEKINTLGNEVRMLREGMDRVEAEVQAKIRRIQEVELENEDINRELESIDKSLLEANGKNEKLSIELESRQSECAFLREEQDGYMLKIGDLQAAIKAANANLTGETDRNKDLEARLAEERHQREVVGTKEKQEVQKMINDLNRELSTSKDDLRKHKTILEQREVEVTTWKERLAELETSLREVLGDPAGTKASFLTVSARPSTDRSLSLIKARPFQNFRTDSKVQLQTSIVLGIPCRRKSASYSAVMRCSKAMVLNPKSCRICSRKNALDVVQIRLNMSNGRKRISIRAERYHRRNLESLS